MWLIDLWVNDVRGRARLRPRDRLFLIMDFQHVVSEKEINNGIRAIFNTFRRVLGQNKLRKEKVIKDYANKDKNIF